MPEAHTRGDILVVDDEPTIGEVVSRYLERAGYATRVAADGDSALELHSERAADLIVLDLMLPGVDGLDVMRRIRKDRTRRPAFILLTAKGEESDRIVGLSLGADDYVVKPFSPAELVARVDAVLRRVDPEPEFEPPLEFGGLRIEPASRRVLMDGEECALTVREYELLLFLARHPGQAFSRHALMDRVWGYSFYTDTSTVTVHIRRLRSKIERDAGAPAAHRDRVRGRLPLRAVRIGLIFAVAGAAVAAALAGAVYDFHAAWLTFVLLAPLGCVTVLASGAVLRRRTGLRRQAVLMSAIAAAQLLVDGRAVRGADVRVLARRVLHADGRRVLRRAGAVGGLGPVAARARRRAGDRGEPGGRRRGPP